MSQGKIAAVERSRQVRLNRPLILGVLLLGTVILYIVIGSFIFTEEDANDTNLRTRWQAPSLEYPFGTDGVGRDIMARTVYGGQTSLAIAGLSVLITLTIGVPIGAVSGYFGGWVDSLLMRLTEALLSIPLLFLVIVLSGSFSRYFREVTILGRDVSGDVVLLVLILGATGWMSLARIVRANILSIKEQDYVLAARALGVGHLGMLRRHLLPNTSAAIIVFVALGVSRAILIESYVSFLGLGITPPTASWGNMLQRSVERLDSAPWLWIFPGLLTIFTVMGVNFIGDGLRDLFDPEH